MFYADFKISVSFSHTDMCPSLPGANLECNGQLWNVTVSTGAGRSQGEPEAMDVIVKSKFSLVSWLLGGSPK